MQQAVISRSSVLNLYKSLIRELKSDQKLLGLIKCEFKKNIVTSSKYCKESNEQFIIANAYLSYLKNTREYFILKSKYAKGERSIEESANIVGLRLPVQFQEDK